jgi:hypothetical protein
MIVDVFDELYTTKVAEVSLTDVQIQESVSLDTIPQLTARPVHVSDTAWQQLSLRRVIEVQGRPWRIEQSRFQYDGSGRPRIVAAPLWADLADRTYKRQGRLRYVALGVSADEALERALKDTEYTHVAPDEEVFITEENISVLNLVRRIADETGFEVEIDAVAKTVSLVERRGSETPKVISPSTGAVRRSLQRQSNASTFFTAVTALGGSEDTFTLGDATWRVSSINTSTGWVELEGAPVWTDGALVDTQLLLTGTDATDRVYAVIESEAPGRVKLSSTAFLDESVHTRARFVRLDAETGDVSGITTLVDPESSADFGIIERRITEEGLDPFENLLQNADLSLWDSGNPVPWQGISYGGGALSISRSTDVADYGTASARVEADSRNGIAQTFEYTPDKLHPYISFWIAVRVEQGQIRLEAIDSDGNRLPKGARAISTVDEIRGLSVEGEKAAEGPITLRVIAEEDDTVFYLDAATITGSASHYQLSEMGPRALWKRAYKVLLEEGGLQADRFTASVWDIGDTPIELGDAVEVTDHDGPDSTFTFESRVVELTTHVASDGTLEKEVRLSQERDDIADLPVSPPSPPTEEPLEPVATPRIAAEYVKDGDTGKAILELDDVDDRFETLEYRAAAGDAVQDAPWTETSSPFSDDTYEITVSLLEKHNATVQWRASFEGFVDQSGTHTFDILAKPSADYSVSFSGDPLQATLIWRGDEDTEGINWRRDGLTVQQETGRSGSVIVGTVDPGDEIRVRAEAFSPDGAIEERSFDQTLRAPLNLSGVATEVVSSINLLKGDVFLDADTPLSITADGQSLSVALSTGDTMQVVDATLDVKGVDGEERLGFELDSFKPGDTAGVTPPQDLRPTAGPVFTSVSSPDYIPRLSGWGITDAGEGDFRSISADELRVQSFIAEVTEAFAGEQLLTESLGVLSEATTTAPASTIRVDALAGLGDIAQFRVGDMLRMRVIERGEDVLGPKADRQGYVDSVRLELASTPIPTQDLEAYLIFPDGTVDTLSVVQDGGPVVETPTVTDPAIVVVVGQYNNQWFATPAHRIDPDADLGYGVWNTALGEVDFESGDPVSLTMFYEGPDTDRIEGLAVYDIWMEVQAVDVQGDGTILYDITLKRGPEGKTAPTGTPVLGYGQNGGFLMERSVIGVGAPYDRQIKWNPGPDGTPESYDIITYTGNLSDLPKAFADGPGFYSENMRATGSLVIGDLSEESDFLKYEDGVLQLSGTLQVGDGDLDDILSGLVREEDLGQLAYNDVVEQARLGSTIIQGGFIRTELLDVDAIVADIIDADEFFTEDFTLKSGGSITAEDQSFSLSAGAGMVLHADPLVGNLQRRSIQWSPDPTNPSLSTDRARISLQDVGSSEVLWLESKGRIYAGAVGGTEIQVRHNEALIEDHALRFMSNADVEVVTNRLQSGLGVMSVDGDIEHTGSITQTSDAAYKTNIQDYSAWDIISSIQPRSFDWQEIRSGHDIGFIAQELESVLPELVKTTRDGTKAVDYSKLSVVALAALKEAKEKIELLEQKMDLLDE